MVDLQCLHLSSQELFPRIYVQDLLFEEIKDSDRHLAGNTFLYSLGSGKTVPIFITMIMDLACLAMTANGATNGRIF